VDGFFGSCFEADFVLSNHKGVEPGRVVPIPNRQNAETKESLWWPAFEHYQLELEFLLTTPLLSCFTIVSSVRLGLKIDPGKIALSHPRIGKSASPRPSSAASSPVIKSGLSLMFELVGYRIRVFGRWPLLSAGISGKILFGKCGPQ